MTLGEAISSTWRDRFAPSPTGPLHLGHAFSALTIWEAVQRENGQFLLRIDDIDTGRSRDHYVTGIFDDLAWLGVEWPTPVMRQSDRRPRYATALQTLIDLGICYPCSCSRRDIQTALSAPHHRPESFLHNVTEIYPGTCRSRSIEDAGPDDTIRLDMRKAIEKLGGENAVGKISYRDIGAQHAGTHFLNVRQLLYAHGDIVLARRDIKTSYHLSVVVDDRDMAVSHVSRGEDLFGSTQIHRLLQTLLDIAPPIWNHHRLIKDEAGHRLAKRDKARSLYELRQSGYSPDWVRKRLGLL